MGLGVLKVTFFGNLVGQLFFDLVHFPSISCYILSVRSCILLIFGRSYK